MKETPPKNNILLVLSAPSGAGKTTLAQKLLELDTKYSLSISSTTRNPRINEEDGLDYYFKSKDEFLKDVDDNKMLEWAKVHGNYYGTLKSEVDRLWKKNKDIIFDIDIQGGINIKKKYPKKTILVFILTATKEELKNRLLQRNTDNLKTIEKRLKNAQKEVKIAMRHYEYLVINDEVDEAFENIKSIVKAFKNKKILQKEVFKRWIK